MVSRPERSRSVSLSRRVAVLVIMAALTGLLVIVVTLPPEPGPLRSIVLVDVGSHGIHLGDLPAALCWLVGVAACVRVWKG